jgi:SAM-dependent methyltransferase
VDRFGVWLSSRAILRRLPAGNGLNVLDLGCGFRATQLIGLGDRVKHGTCVDFRIADEVKNRPNVSVIEGSVEEAVSKLAANSFDAVFLISILEHLKSPASVLSSIHDLLKPGGVLLINVPTWRGKWFLELSAFRLGLSPKVEMDDHKMYYDKRDLWPMLVQAGFKPSCLRLNYHKFGLNLFAVASK